MGGPDGTPPFIIWVVGMEDDCVAELVTFRSTRGSYVYAPIPSATSYGHRAELWNPEDWFKEVKTKVVSANDTLFVRMEDLETGELFAECPLPSDGTPLTTAVEPVVDSSRYFVLRIADRQDPKKHAFIGLGFRERSESSDFAAALDEYRLYLRRKREALQRKEAFDKQQQEQAEGQQAGAGSSSPGSSGMVGAIQSPITLRIGAIKSKTGGPELPSPGFLSRAVSFPLKSADTVGVLKLQPPPAPRPAPAPVGAVQQVSGEAVQLSPAGPTGPSGAPGDAGVEAGTTNQDVDGMRRLSFGNGTSSADGFHPFGEQAGPCSNCHEASSAAPQRWPSLGSGKDAAIAVPGSTTAASPSDFKKQISGVVGVVVTADADDDNWGDFVG